MVNHLQSKHGLITLSVFIFFAPFALVAPTRSYAQDGGNGSNDITNKRVSLNLDGADIRSALRLLFDSVGANYTLDNSIEGTVTVSLHDVPFHVALDSLLRSTSSTMPLTYRVENGVYQIMMKQQQQNNYYNQQQNNTNNQQTSTASQQHTVKIPVNFADAADIATAFGGSVIEPRYSSLGGGLGGGFGGGFGGGYGGGMMRGGMGGFGGGMMGGMGGFGGGMMGGGMGGFGGGMMGGGMGGYGGYGGGYGGY